MAAVAGDVLRAGKPQRAVATSKTFRSLARICGAAPSDDGPYVPRALNRDDLSRLDAEADQDVRRPSGPTCPGCRPAGRRSWSPARWSRTR